MAYTLSSCLWELTLRCNLKCLHCGSIAGSPRIRELELDQCFTIANEIVELKCKELTFIGGEIFLYKDWEMLAHYLTNLGVRVNIMSNGFTIGPKEIDQIKFAGLKNVGISLDGTKEIHNLIRRNINSFTGIQNSFNCLNEAGIPIGVVTSLLEMNYFYLDEIYNLLVLNNVVLWQIQVVNPMGNMIDKKDLIMSPDHIPDLISFICERNKDKKMLIVAADNVGYYYNESEGFIRGRSSPICYWSGCAAGISSVFIDSVGNVKGCGALYDVHFIEGNLRKSSLKEIWSNEENFSYNRKFRSDMLTGTCKGCDVGSVCQGGCRASNYFMTDSLYTNAFCPHNVNN
jgi:radical SAM protein with 4Fe4S-binding SPASM domain